MLFYSLKNKILCRNFVIQTYQRTNTFKEKNLWVRKNKSWYKPADTKNHFLLIKVTSSTRPTSLSKYHLTITHVSLVRHQVHCVFNSYSNFIKYREVVDMDNRYGLNGNENIKISSDLIVNKFGGIQNLADGLMTNLKVSNTLAFW